MEVFLIVSTSALAFFGLIRIYKIKQHEKTSYYKATNNSYYSLDIGQYGEYLIYKKLRYLEKQGCKFLFNLYIPKPNNKTTEIDVLLITHKGLFVIESKNFSGWIFGNESYKNWVQTLPVGRGYSQKEYFYNPISQNATHIKYLKPLLDKDIPIHSFIVFSNRCTLMDIKIRSRNVNVLNRAKLSEAYNEAFLNIEGDQLSQEEIDKLYEKLYPYTQNTNEEKVKHVFGMR